MSTVQTPEPRAMWLRAWVISIFLAGAYSGLGHWIDLIILPVALLVCAVVFLPMVYGGTAKGIMLRLVIAVIGGLIGVVMLWGIWYALEFSWPALVDAFKLSPQQMVDRILALSDQYTYSVETDYGTNTHGTGFTKAIWATETAAFGLMPVIGALIGPRGINAFRRWAAKYEAKRAGR